MDKGLAEDAMKGVADELTCAICLDLFKSPAFLPCGHRGCKACFTQCVSVHRKCPVCNEYATVGGLKPDAMAANLVERLECIKKMGLHGGDGGMAAAAAAPSAAQRTPEWYQPWLKTVHQALEKAFTREATSVVLVGIKGDPDVLKTARLWPRLMVDLEAHFDKEKIHGLWTLVEETRLPIDCLSAKIRAQASGQGYVVIASAPSGEFAVIEKLCKANPNAIVALPDATRATASASAAASASRRHLSEANILARYKAVKGRRKHEAMDERDGWATYTWPDGDEYIGEWRDRKQHGQGLYRFSNGECYVGEFKDGTRHGEGTVTFPNGEKYYGKYSRGMPSGEGTYEYANGDRYEGHFSKGLKSGKGSFFYKNGDVFKGQYQNDKQNGLGKYTFANGDFWDGAYKNGKQHGRGVYGWMNGERIEEEWRDGVKV
mmetsp:Transcript_25828/g.67797  ORF Transcript_25828/g.67797 Transcript_25828/m.67797 type:complete len:432 (-) Transcript_25828:26-1321(-)